MMTNICTRRMIYLVFFQLIPQTAQIYSLMAHVAHNTILINWKTGLLGHPQQPIYPPVALNQQRWRWCGGGGVFFSFNCFCFFNFDYLNVLSFFNFNSFFCFFNFDYLFKNVVCIYCQMYKYKFISPFSRMEG